MSKIAIIPARGGSKRIPNKNLKNFLGKPILSYSISSALKSQLFDEVMVSTDSEEIADVAKALGANVPFLRSRESSDDQATTFEVIQEVIEDYKSLNFQFEFGCCLYPTAPFASADVLSFFYSRLLDSNFDCVFPIVRYSYPIQRALHVAANQKVQMIHPEHLVTRSQDLSPTFHDAGQLYWFRTKQLLKAKRLWTENTGAFEISELESQDIDNLVDWKLAEIKYQLLSTK